MPFVGSVLLTGILVTPPVQTTLNETQPGTGGGLLPMNTAFWIVVQSKIGTFLASIDAVPSWRSTRTPATGIGTVQNKPTGGNWLGFRSWICAPPEPGR